jgi:RNA polymerase sigma-70 factor (ECF subfamily)
MTATATQLGNLIKSGVHRMGEIEIKIDDSNNRFSLHHFEDFSYKEISESMNLSLSAIESLIFRAKQQLIKQLKDPILQNWI